MKILIVSDDLFVGGAAKNVVDVANELLQRGHDVTVASGEGEYCNRLHYSIRHHLLPIYHKNTQIKNYAGIVLSYTLLYGLIKKNNYEIVHTNKRITNALVEYMPLSTGVHHVTHYHNTFSDKKIFTSFGHFTICCSNTARNSLIKNYRFKEERSIVIHYGITPFRQYNSVEKVPIYKELGINPMEKVIASIGLFAPYKDRKNLIRAIALLQQIRNGRMPHFLIQGYGPEEDLLQKMIIEYRLQQFVKLLPYDYNVESVMNIADFMIINSSESEGFPIVILEGASIGKIHIGTMVGGIGEFIEDGVTGKMIPPKDPVVLANTIQQLLDQPQEIEKMGQNAKNLFYTNYTLQAMIDKIEKVYTNVLQNKK